jgi:adhesin transport system outer membrane protein
MLQSHPRLKSGEQNVAAAKEGENRAWGAFLPTISVDSNAGYNRVDSPTLRSQRRAPTSMNADGITLQATQNVFDGFGRSSRYNAAQVNTQIQDANLEALRQGMIYEAVAAYLDVLRHNQIVELARNNERTVQRQLNLEDERVQRGGGMAVDALLARARLQLARERRTAYEGNLVDSRARYLQAIGKSPNPATMVDPLAPTASLPQTLEDALKIAEGQNPVVKGANLQIDFAGHRRAAAEADYYPRVDLVARQIWEHNVDGIQGPRRDFAAFVRVTWELFSGFQTRYSVAEASQQWGAAKDGHAYTNRKVVEETRLAWNELMVARERVRLLENAVNIAS